MTFRVGLPDEWHKGGFQYVSIPGHVHDPIKDDQLCGSTLRNSTPHMEFGGGGCLCLYFSFLGVFLFLKHFLLWHSSWTVDSSVNITSSKASFSSILLLHQSNLFNLLAYRIAWQYLAVAKVQPSSFLSLAIALIPYCTLSEPNLLTRMSFRSVAVNSSFSAMGSSIQL